MEIISAEYVKGSATYKQCPPADKPEYAFIGRSNVGKSSLINMITNKRGLAKISATPGKTQLINHFTIISKDRRNWYLVDLPGYGYANVSQKARNNWSNMIESYIRKRENMVCLFILVDSRLEPQAVDIDFINKIGEWQIPFVLVFTKSDKNKPAAIQRNVENFLRQMDLYWTARPPYFTSSSIAKTGRKELLEYIGKLNENMMKI